MEETPLPGYSFVVTMPGRCGGRPTLAGTRLEPDVVADYIAGYDGQMSVEEFLAQWSYVSRAAVAEALLFAFSEEGRAVREAKYAANARARAELAG